MNIRTIAFVLPLSIIAIGCTFPSATSAADLPSRIESPDGNVVIDFVLQDRGSPAYKLQYMAKPIVLESKLGFEPDLTRGFHVANAAVSSHEGQWSPLYGERKNIPDNYRELNVDLKQDSGKLLRITFLAYNEGAALRYTYPRQGDGSPLAFTAEQTEFRFPPETFGYEEHGTEGVYQRSKIADIQPQCERPLTMEFASGACACLTEADCLDYPRMLLMGLPGVSGAMVSELGGTTSNTARRGSQDDGTNGHGTLAAGDSSPWRVFILGQKPGDLLERNYLVLDLSPPIALTDTDWIVPGKVMRETSLTTAGAETVIDFAATGGFSYLEFDWHWYGSDSQDAGTVRARNLNLPEVIQYGAAKHVGVIVYCDRTQIRAQRDILFPLFEKWGLKGVKIGFVDVGPQAETAWITETVRKAAEHHLLLDIHDGYRPTGLSRSYPNLMTVEGIRGNEHFPTPEHNCTVPFTRYPAGPADYTVCYLQNRDQTTSAHQMAMAVVSYSPLQFIYWYGKPSDFTDLPELEFFRHVPTVWDDTKVINGKIGEFATIARQSGEQWFIGTINNSQPRTLEIPLAFLSPGRKYLAHLYSDDDTAKTKSHIGIETRPVDPQTLLRAPLRAAGGQAIWIEPMPN